jgi:P27 family predicted phage terminase small subunit
MNKNEPKPKNNIPSAPDHLSADAKIEWDRISLELFELGLLSDLDRAALSAYCQAWSRWVKAEIELENKTLVISTSNGNLIQNPLIGISNSALEVMRKFLVEFGLTPSSRSSIQGPASKEKTNRFSDLSK